MRKWLCGSVVTAPGPVIAKVFDHAEARDPAHARPWVVLVDGARHQLDLITAEAARRRIRVHIVIDFVHVLEKDWVAGHALALLAGHTGQVITTLTTEAATAGAQHHDGIEARIRHTGWIRRVTHGFAGVVPRVLASGPAFAACSRRGRAAALPAAVGDGEWIRCVRGRCGRACTEHTDPKGNLARIRSRIIAGQSMIKARPAGFEPATVGLEA
ncbi:hypothetical protein [Nonomuraea bangladeshensis]|uniref:hypothetical protein n=1 Tax=Nonomuraea bangladeshensis TaxID=404385 RepID=UPI003F4DEE95